MHFAAISSALPVRVKTAFTPSVNKCAILTSGTITGRPMANSSGNLPGNLRSSNGSILPGCTNTSAKASKSGKSVLDTKPKSVITAAVSGGN